MRHFAFTEFFTHCNGDEIRAALSREDFSSNLFSLVMLLSLIRDRIGVPIVINSGYRTPYRNQIVGGVFNSQHLRCAAADVRCSPELDEYLETHIDSLGAFAYQLIRYDNFWHIGIKENSKHKFKYIDKRTKK